MVQNVPFFLRPGVDLRAPKFSQHHAVISLVRTRHRIFKEQAEFKRRVLQESGRDSVGTVSTVASEPEGSGFHSILTFVS